MDHTRRDVIIEHSMMIDKALTQNAACLTCVSHVDNASYLQKHRDLMKILKRMDKQLSKMETATHARSVTAQIAELARRSSNTLAHMRSSLRAANQR